MVSDNKLTKSCDEEEKGMIIKLIMDFKKQR
jgi:hypothetical protein